MPKPKRRPLWIRVLAIAAYGIVCGVALFMGAAFNVVRQTPLIEEMIGQTLRSTPPQEVFDKPDLTMLVLGCDEDLYYGGIQVLKQQARSDMMMVARLDFENKQITGVSIPRDTLYRLPGYRLHKINAYHAIGGKDLARRAVEGMLGIKIDRVVVLDFQKFKEMVDLVGGVTVTVEKPMDYDDHAAKLHIHLKPGEQHLMGEDAMGFVRFRHDSDFMRQKRQREFILAFKDSVMRQPAVLARVANKAIAVLGNELSAREVASLARFGRSLEGSAIEFGQVPVIESGRASLKLDRRALPSTLKKFKLASAVKPYKVSRTR